MAQHAMIGYRRKPKWIYVIPCIYLLFPIILLVQIFSENPVLGKLQILFAQPTLMLDVFCSVSAALCVLIVSRYSLVYLVGLTVYFVGFKAFQLYVGGWETSFELSVVAFWFAAPLLFLTTTLRVPYFYPEARWWKRLSRFAHKTRGTIYFSDLKFPVVMMDFSKGGAFVKLDRRLFNAGAEDHREQRDDQVSPLHPFLSSEERIVANRSVEKFPKKNEIVRIVIKTSPALDSPYMNGLFEAQALVVWSTKAVDPMQHGLGLKFIGLSFGERLKLRKYLKLFESKSS